MQRTRHRDAAHEIGSYRKNKERTAACKRCLIRRSKSEDRVRFVFERRKFLRGWKGLSCTYMIFCK